MAALPKWDEYVSEEEYFAILEKSEERLEWIDGRVYPKNNPYGLLPEAMAGASDPHIDINTSILVAVANLLRGKNCFVVNARSKGEKWSQLFVSRPHYLLWTARKR